jgi:serine/threonine protein kinase
MTVESEIMIVSLEIDVFFCSHFELYVCSLFNYSTRFKSENNLYMLMEYAPAGSIGSQIAFGRGLKHSTPSLITFYSACLIEAIEYMHLKGVVHRDIKPDNLLIGKDGYLKVCDYGLSKFLPIGEKTKTFLGTLAYMPPEQLGGSYYDHSVDYWGLGVCMYEMNYGYTPFEPHDMLTAEEWKTTLKTNIKKGVLHFPDKVYIYIHISICVDEDDDDDDEYDNVDDYTYILMITNHVLFIIIYIIKKTERRLSYETIHEIVASDTNPFKTWQRLGCIKTEASFLFQAFQVASVTKSIPAATSAN